MSSKREYLASRSHLSLVVGDLVPPYAFLLCAAVLGLLLAALGLKVLFWRFGRYDDLAPEVLGGREYGHCLGLREVEQVPECLLDHL